MSEQLPSVTKGHAATGDGTTKDEIWTCEQDIHKFIRRHGEDVIGHMDGTLDENEKNVLESGHCPLPHLS